MYPCHVYAIKLETAFRRGDNCPFSADAFESKFQETLERGLLRLSAENLIESSEINAWVDGRIRFRRQKAARDCGGRRK